MGGLGLEGLLLEAAPELPKPLHHGILVKSKGGFMEASAIKRFWKPWGTLLSEMGACFRGPFRGGLRPGGWSALRLLRPLSGRPGGLRDFKAPPPCLTVRFCHGSSSSS